MDANTPWSVYCNGKLIWNQWRRPKRGMIIYARGGFYGISDVEPLSRVCLAVPSSMAEFNKGWGVT